MAALFSSLSALVMGTVSAAKAVVTEIIPPAAALVANIMAIATTTASASVAWFICYLCAVAAAAVDVATDTLPYAVAVARTAACSAVQSSRLALQVLLSYLWSLSSAAVAGAARLATVMLPAAVALAESLVGAAWSLLAAAAAVVVHTLPYAVRASQPWLEMTSNLLRQLYGWSLAAAAQEPPDMAQAFKDVVESATRLSQSLRRLYGWLVATAAEKLETDAAYACAAAASEKLNPSDADASAVVSRMEAEASAMIQHGWRSWFLHDRGVAVCVLLALALLAVAFICGGVCALTLSSRLAGRQDHGDRRRSGFASSSASARGHNACSGCHNIRLNHPLRKHITID